MGYLNDPLLNFVKFTQLHNWSVSNAYIHNMQSNFPSVPLLNVLKRVKDVVAIQDNNLYKRITVRLYGLGVQKRDEEEGKNIGTKRQFIVKPGQLIISRIDARNGAFGIVPSDLDAAVVTNDFWLYDVKDANSKYLLLILSSQRFQKYWQSKSSGTTNRQRVDENKFLNSLIPLPLIETQNALILKYNATLEEAEENERKATNLEENIINIVTNMLGIIDLDKVELNGLSTIKFSQIHKWGLDFLTAKRSIYNKKFNAVPISSICDVGSGGTPDRSTEAYYSGDIPWVKTGEIINEIIMDTEEKITMAAVNNSSAKIYPKGSLLIAMYGQGLTRGRTAKLGINAATNQACAVLYNIDTNKVLVDYLWVYLQGEYHRMRSLAYGNNQPNLNGQMIKDYPVVLPPKTSKSPHEISQEKIVNEIFSIKLQVKAYRQKAESLRELAKTQFEEAVFGEA